MIHPPVPHNEKERLKALHNLNIINSDPEECFDNITELASYICNMPISMITLVDETRQWFKSKTGTDMCDSDRDVSFCSHAILEPQNFMEVEDTHKDPRFHDNPLANDGDNPIRYYGGMPLLNSAGMALGTLCVIDTKVNKLNEHQIKALKALAKQVETLFEARYKNFLLEEARKDLDDHNTLLKDFAGVVSHDMKMPLANMVLTADVIKKKYGHLLGEDGKKYLDQLKRSGLNLSDYITGILNHYESEKLANTATEEIDLHNLLEDIIDLLGIEEDCEINFPKKNVNIKINRAALEQIFLNLISNSLKYNNKERIIIDIGFEKQGDFYVFTVEDNGIGVKQEEQKEIFKLFSTLSILDRKGNKGHGIGLTTVKKLVTNLGGTVKIKSELEKGTKFTFTVQAT
ncbi:GAF domain-containing sensor histidine kinase [Salegentibacter sp. F188]|uniref:histidine kinase n=1 Tax=Autumnicola patrickiae TaxID=3075591 RepID=A0ABU3E3J1_9FLAO|nr:GAF domain-containing sensor histidine kinase [Salegentibacter sp. F188]MDT0690566.1 GAF domain-containing sensor histidine kinase [Salegentibacter sp. F188]